MQLRGGGGGEEILGGAFEPWELGFRVQGLGLPCSRCHKNQHAMSIRDLRAWAFRVL